MSKLVIQTTPPPPEDGCLVKGLLAIAVISGIYLLNPYPAAGVGAWVTFIGSAGLAGAFYWAGRERTRQTIEETAAWATSAEDTARRIGATDSLQPITDLPLNLPASEVCYWQGDVVWCEYRAVTTRIQYHGPVLSIPIMKGLRYRAGVIAPSVERKQQLMPVHHGRLYVTSKRLLLDGDGANVQITWRSVLGVTLFQGGVRIDKGSGKDAFLMIERGAEEAAALMARQL